MRVAGVPVDRNRLAWWLAAELGECHAEVSLWSRTKRCGAMVLFVEGAGWRLVQHQFDLDRAEPKRPGSHYRTYTPGAGAWWVRRRDFAPECHPGTDWFVEQGFVADNLVAMWGDAQEAPA